MQTGFAPILLLVGVLVLASFAGGAYIFIKGNSLDALLVKQDAPTVISKSIKENNLPQFVSEQSQNLLQNSKIIPPKQSEFNDYSNKDLGFEFKAAKDLNIKGDSEDDFNKRGNGDFRKNFQGYIGYEPGRFLGAVVVLNQDQNFDINPFSVWIFENPNNLTADGWFDKYWYYPFLWGVFDWTSKGHVALDVEATVSGKLAKYKVVSYQSGSPKYIYVSKDQKMYLFRIIGKTGDEILNTLNWIQ